MEEKKYDCKHENWKDVRTTRRSRVTLNAIIVYSRGIKLSVNRKCVQWSYFPIIIQLLHTPPLRDYLDDKKFIPAIICWCGKNIHCKCCSAVNFIMLLIRWGWIYKFWFIQMIHNFKVKLLNKFQNFQNLICLNIYINVNNNYYVKLSKLF